MLLSCLDTSHSESVSHSERQRTQCPVPFAGNLGYMLNLRCLAFECISREPLTQKERVRTLHVHRFQGAPEISECTLALMHIFTCIFVPSIAIVNQCCFESEFCINMHVIPETLQHVFSRKTKFSYKF